MPHLSRNSDVVRASLESSRLAESKESSHARVEVDRRALRLLPTARASHHASMPRHATGALLPMELMATRTRNYRFTKRLFDLSLSLLLLPGIAVLLLIIAIVVALTSGFPIFYRQRRLGQHDTTFQIIKFRTMRHKASQVLADWLASHPEAQQEWQETHKLKDDPRITRFGRFLRETSLDELPQIFNVLRGEMSLVGPRPIIQAERCRYSEHFVFYSAALPGVTGLWQVSGRCNVTYDERVRMDVNYVRHWSLRRDLVILLRTPRSVFCREGAY